MEEQGELDTGLLKLCWYLGRVSGASGVGVWSKAMLPSSVLQLWEQRRALQVCSEARWKATADNSPSSPTNEPPPVLHVVGNVLLIRHWRIHSQTTSWGNFLETQEKPKEERFFDPKESGEPYLFRTLGWQAGRAEDKVCVPQREVTIRKSYILPLSYCLKRTFTQRTKMEENQHLFRTFWLLSPDLCWQGSGSVSGSTTSEKRLLSQHLSCGTARLVCRQVAAERRSPGHGRGQPGIRLCKYRSNQQCPSEMQQSHQNFPFSPSLLPANCLGPGCQAAASPRWHGLFVVWARKNLNK